MPVDGRETPTRTVLPRPRSLVSRLSFSRAPHFTLLPSPSRPKRSLFRPDQPRFALLDFSTTLLAPPSRPLHGPLPFPCPGRCPSSPFSFRLFRFDSRNGPASRCRWVNTDGVRAIFAWGGRKEWSYSKSATTSVPPFPVSPAHDCSLSLRSPVQFLVATTVQSFWSETTRNIMPPLEPTVRELPHTSCRAVPRSIPPAASPSPSALSLFMGLPALLYILFNCIFRYPIWAGKRLKNGAGCFHCNSNTASMSHHALYSIAALQRLCYYCCRNIFSRSQCISSNTECSLRRANTTH